MSKEKIPTIQFSHTEGEIEYTATLYQWLTQEEEDKAQSILTGSNEITSTEGDKMTIVTTLDKTLAYRASRVESLLKSPSYAEFSVWHPEAREALILKVGEILDKKKSSKK